MIDAGRCRKLINGDLHGIRQMFRWAVGEDLTRPDQLAALKAVEPLEKGRTRAKERPPIRPVSLEAVRATLPECSPPVRAMVMLQLLAATRPGEAIGMRPCGVDRSDPTAWIYRPASHKTEHHDKGRVVVLSGPGPRGGSGTGCCATPGPGASRRPRCSPRGSVPGSARAPRRWPGPSRAGSTRSGAIAQRSSERAFPHPTIEAIPPRKRTEEQRAELKRWRVAHHWHPNRLRHTAGR